MAETPRMQSRNGGRGNSRSVSAQKWGALIGGSALAIYGISRKSTLGMALAAGGGTLALMSTNRKPSHPRPSAWTSLLINCTPEQAYRFWRDLENLPRFMKRLESVTVSDNTHSRWTALGPMGKRIHWDAEITGEAENEYIAWRSLPGSDIHVDGRVEFKTAPAGRGTLVSARMEFRPAMGKSSAMAKFFSKGANFTMRQEMRRLEALIETGEIPTTEGQSHGPRDFVTGVMRVADPTRPIRPETSLNEAPNATRRSA
jgi:uncharacterized membrane protein